MRYLLGFLVGLFLGLVLFHTVLVFTGWRTVATYLSCLGAFVGTLGYFRATEAHR